MSVFFHFILRNCIGPVFVPHEETKWGNSTNRSLLYTLLYYRITVEKDIDKDPRSVPQATGVKNDTGEKMLLEIVLLVILVFPENGFF